MTTQTATPTLYHIKGTNQTATDRRHLADQLWKVYGERASLSFGSHGIDDYYVDVDNYMSGLHQRIQIQAR